MKLAAFVSRFFIAAFALSTGLACSLGAAATAVAPTPSVQVIIPTSAPATAIAPTQAPPTVLPTAQPQVAKNTQGNTYASAPLILLLRSSGGADDIFAWDLQTRALKQLTTWGYNSAPHISPNGQWLVYLSEAQAAVTASQAGAINMQFFNNIWLLNPYTLESIRIADQPANATFASGNLIRRVTDPVWSPDGGSVAWIESDAQGERLGIYSMAAKTAATYPLNLPAICCEGAYRTIFWGRSGIAITANEGTFAKLEQSVYVFSPQGQQLTRTALATDTYLEYGWAVDDANHEFLAGVTNGEFTLIDPFNSSSAIQGYPEMVSVASPLTLGIHPTRGSGLWTVTRQGQHLIDFNDITDPRKVTIAPDANSLAYVEGDYLRGGNSFVYLTNGQIIPLTPQQTILAVTWGATSWHIHPN